MKLAAKAAKIARENNNSHELSVMAKKVGSNWLLENKRLDFLPVPPHNLLAQSAPAPSKSTPTPNLC